MKKTIYQKITAITCLLAVLLLTLTGCKKENEKKSRTELLTTASWILNAFSVNPAIDLDFDGDLDTDLYALLEACEKDDFQTFSTNGTLTVNDGNSKCDPADPQTETLNWSFTNNETQIVVDGLTYTITELSEGSFKIRYAEVIGSVTYNNDLSFVKE